MPDNNYMETTISGTQWRRADRIEIFNPYNETPFLVLTEAEITVVGEQKIMRYVDNMRCEFDPTNQLHQDIYNTLNQLYVLLREARDAEAGGQ